MLLLPIAARELLIQGRLRSTYWIRVAAAAAAGVLMLWILLMDASSAALAEFYSSLALTHLIAWALLALSCMIVPRVCVERPQGRRQAHWNAWRRRWILGEEGARAAFRRRLLDLNPCFWLSSREPLPEPMKSALYSVVSSNQNGLAIIHAAPSLRSGRYATDWKSSGGGRYSVQCPALVTVSHLLLYEVFFEAEDGDFAGAQNSVHRLLDLSHSLDFEPAFIFQLQRTMCFSKAILALEWWLNRCLVPETELLAIKKELIEAEDKTDMQLPLVQIRYRVLVEYPDELSSYYRSPPASTVFSRPGPPGSLAGFRRQLQGRIDDLTGAKDRGVIALLDRMDEFTRIVQAPLPERLYRARSLANKYPAAYPGDPSPHLWLSPSEFRNDISRQAEFVAGCRAAVASLAIEQYRLHHGGRLPETLDRLVPEYLGVVPQDPFDGQPLRYQRWSKGYCIYSVGENGRDDGGASSSDLSFSVGALKDWHVRSARSDPIDEERY